MFKTATCNGNMKGVHMHPRVLVHPLTSHTPHLGDGRWAGSGSATAISGSTLATPGSVATLPEASEWDRLWGEPPPVGEIGCWPVAGGGEAGMCPPLSKVTPVIHDHLHMSLTYSCILRWALYYSFQPNETIRNSLQGETAQPLKWLDFPRAVRWTNVCGHLLDWVNAFTDRVNIFSI